MKRFLILITPLILIMLAFRPVKSHTITGTITDDKGSPLPSVSVTLKGGTQGTLSDAKGVYRITVPKSSGTLLFSGVGYTTVQENINGRHLINVTLPASQNYLQEVVIARGQANASKMKTTESYNKQIVGGTFSQPVPNSYYSTDKDEEELSREGYDNISENIFLKATDNPLSTFSIDVDAASYSNVRRFLNQGQLPPAGAVRIEEMVNYFKYAYPQPTENDPFSINTEISDAPWNKDHKLVLIGLQEKKLQPITCPLPIWYS